MSHLRIIKREDIDPCIGQGRPHHNPERDLDIMLTLLLVVGPVFVVVFGVWLIAEIITKWPK